MVEWRQLMLKVSYLTIMCLSGSITLLLHYLTAFPENHEVIIATVTVFFML